MRVTIRRIEFETIRDPEQQDKYVIIDNPRRLVVEYKTSNGETKTLTGDTPELRGLVIGNAYDLRFVEVTE